MANCSHITDGPASGLPADMLIYPEQLCQVPAMNANGANQWQRESLMRNLAAS
ncbi:MAG: hypothetical protein WDO13_08125 [Verrucomicrobiota bacterium]